MVARTRTTFINNNVFRWLLKIVFIISGSLILVSLGGCKEHFIGMLNPKGIIAFEQRKLFFDTLALMLIVVLPVIIMSITFVYHYQVSHRTKDYKPNWGHNFYLEVLWWGIPCVIILVLAIMTWKKTHELDPYRPIAGQAQKPLLVQVIALPWKWLFIYPEQNIATVNYLKVPLGQQVEYWITADNVPMSAFFIPQLGSQIYAMAGMRTRLHLLASEPGVYDGLNTQYNGDGFSDMHFEVHVVEPQTLQQWFTEVKKSPDGLTDASYNQLLYPSIADKPKLFSGVQNDLFDKVIMTYMESVGRTHPRENIVKFHKE
ncbi:ubiquinol oxidase subunit II [Legionella waltersii]|uniref:Ubiquinol oxidase subunit 2 n=1 Tax=Legionella waltersii TaxID=66969 RepID=A0A0W1ACD7_9GAMM|nr:ubiquinol oxidase subunit II [Legionella waltersii]KTD78771.1 cytochrome o ubiquinol oxidase subunit II [Legionella waltersii]SNV11225.1 cytochrome o ubiquinol oxidase subunit II [Legionella waltersii]